jgi:hypothetical protein
MNAILALSLLAGPALAQSGAQQSTTSCENLPAISMPNARVTLAQPVAAGAFVGAEGPRSHCAASSRPTPHVEGSPPPPRWLRGDWTRDWIEVRGARSSRFVVHYLQTPRLFADMRIPIQRPAFPNATSFANLSDADLATLAQQRGFAGWVSAAADTFTWHHEIDFQPSDGTLDIGRVERVDSAHWYEHALDSSYVESWRSTAPGDTTFLVLRGERAGRLDQMLLVVGDRFLYVRNRSIDLPEAPSLDSLIARTHAGREQIIAYLDCEFSWGRVHGGARPWQVDASTLPWREGQSLPFVSTVALTADSTGPLVRGPGLSWSVPVNTLSKTQLATLFPGPH